MNDLNPNAIGVIGNGSWGTALTKILTDNGHRIHWWVRNETSVNYLKQRKHNPHYLTSVRFEEGQILPGSNLKDILDCCGMVVFAVPSAFAQSVIESVPASAWKSRKIVSAIKGILPDCNLLLNDYLTAHLDFDLDHYVAITGPCHAEEVADERLSYLTFSGLSEDLTSGVAAAFRTPYINTSHNHDIWGAQFAAVLKNIYAIGAGIAHGLDYGDNFLSVLITNCYREMYHYLKLHFQLVHPSSDEPDFHTSAYLGDLLVTCYSLHSRNRTLGTMLGKGYTVKAATLEMNMVAEGYYAARGMHSIAKVHSIRLPLADAIYEILWKNEPAATVFSRIENVLS